MVSPMARFGSRNVSRRISAICLCTGAFFVPCKSVGGICVGQQCRRFLEAGLPTMLIPPFFVWKRKKRISNTPYSRRIRNVTYPVHLSHPAFCLSLSRPCSVSSCGIRRQRRCHMNVRTIISHCQRAQNDLQAAIATEHEDYHRGCVDALLRLLADYRQGTKDAPAGSRGTRTRGSEVTA